ncbi:MAG: putative C-S lyase [Bacteroidales bacterium]|nr:putative C-S lyase [Bacteroidales bacterium]
MMWNFDEVINRENSSCIKYDLREEVFGRADVIPMWVADMDFRTPSFITEALAARLKHEIFGYSYRPDAYFSSFIDWLTERHRWSVRREWIEFSPGVVPALNMCTLAFTDPGEEIIIQPPVYTPFHGAVTDHGRRLVFNNLIETPQGWVMDIEGLRNLINPATRMLILSNPHNPVGRAWRREELEEIVEICHEKGVVILSDEIHSDLVLPGHSHIPLASISEKAASITVTCMAPSKTFNLAGFSTSSMIIPDPVLMEKYRRTLVGLHLHLGNIFGNVASEAAYTHGHEWLDELLQYIQGNVDLVVDFCREHLPQIRPVPPEATYMIWLDCRGMGLDGAGLQKFFVEKAGVGMNEGSRFGPGGQGFMRMNLACPRSVVEKALKQIKSAING